MAFHVVPQAGQKGGRRAAEHLSWRAGGESYQLSTSLQLDVGTGTLDRVLQGNL